MDFPGLYVLKVILRIRWRKKLSQLHVNKMLSRHDSSYSIDKAYTHALWMSFLRAGEGQGWGRKECLGAGIQKGATWWSRDKSVAGVWLRSNHSNTFQVYSTHTISLLESFILLDFTISHGTLLFYTTTTYKRILRLSHPTLSFSFYALIREIRKGNSGKLFDDCSRKYS